MIRFGALVYKLSIQFLSNNAEAEDAVQEVFVRLWKTADRFDPRKAKLVTWVMLITRRHLIDCIRRKTVRPKSHELGEHHQSFCNRRARDIEYSEYKNVMPPFCKRYKPFPRCNKQ